MSRFCISLCRHCGFSCSMESSENKPLLFSLPIPISFRISIRPSPLREHAPAAFCSARTRRRDIIGADHWPRVSGLAAFLGSCVEPYPYTSVPSSASSYLVHCLLDLIPSFFHHYFSFCPVPAKIDPSRTGTIILRIKHRWFFPAMAMTTIFLIDFHSATAESRPFGTSIDFFQNSHCSFG